MRLTITAAGRPAPQGSKESGGAGQLLESSAYLPAWRTAVKLATYRRYQELGIDPTALPLFPVGVPVIVEHCSFYVTPEQCRGRGTDEPVGTPDIDKLLRAVLDALGGMNQGSARLFADDSQVVRIRDLCKIRVGPGERPGMVITVSDGRD